MDLYNEFVQDFLKMSGNFPQAIMAWFVQKEVEPDQLGKALVTMANTLFRGERFVEAYWVFKACKTGFPEKPSIDLIDQLMASAKERCIAKAFQWLESEVICPPQEKPFLQKQLFMNISEIVEKNPALGAQLFNSPLDRRLEIELLPDQHLSDNRRFLIIDLDSLPPRRFDYQPIDSVEYGKVENGVCFYGLGGGAQVLSMFAITQIAYPYPQIGLYILEWSWSIFKANMAINTWNGLFDSERLFWYVGKEGYEAFFSYLRNEKQFLPSFGLHIDLEMSADAPAKVNAIVKEKEQEYFALMKQVENFYQNRSADEWREIFNRKKPLRVLGLTSIFTVYLQYCMRDWLDGFRSLGCETMLLIEKKSNVRLTNLYSLDMINRFEPDLILGICYNRSNFSFQIPQNIPFINWQQDKLKHCRTPETINSIKETDCIVTTYAYTLSWMLDEGYPKEKIYNSNYYPTNTNIYKPVRLSFGELEKYRCDVSFVSNCSQTAEESFKKLCEEYQHLGNRHLRFLSLFYEMIEEKFISWKSYPTNTDEYEILFKAFCEKEGIEDLPDKLIEEISYKFHFIGDRFLRHMPLETLSKNGVNLALYGHGWETNPRLGRFARGIARNGTELNLINNASKIVYHAISTSTFHPRFIDAAASGSFILVKHLESDFDPVARLFENGAEFLYFDGPLDISDKVTYYLNHEDERSKIAANICQKVQSYSYSHFAKSIVEMIATDPLNIKTV